MKELVGKLRRVDVVPCKKVDLEKLYNKIQKDTEEVMHSLFMLELKRIDKMNKFLASKEYYSFLKFVTVESKKLIDKINKKASNIVDEGMLIEIVADTIQPKLSVKRTDDIRIPSVSSEDLLVSDTPNAIVFGRYCNGEWNNLAEMSIDSTEKIEELSKSEKPILKEPLKEEVKISKVVLKENVKKIRKITKKEDEI